MSQEKKKTAFWLFPETKATVEAHFREDNCASQSEYVEKAILFYTGYLNSQKTNAYLPRLIGEILDAKLDMLGDRIGRLLFKLSVEESMLMHIIASDTDVDAPTLDRLRGRCVQDVKRTNGGLSFKEILKFQKGL